jgi:hypothetical protein
MACSLIAAVSIRFNEARAALVPAE